MKDQDPLTVAGAGTQATREGGVDALRRPTGIVTTDDPATVDLATDRLEGQAFHDVQRSLREAGPVSATTFFAQPAAFIGSFDLVRQVLRDDDNVPGAPTYELSTRPVIGHTFIDSHGPEHHRVRALATPAFRSRAIERFDAAGLADLAEEVVGRIVDRGTADLVEAVTTVVPYLAIARKLGLPPSGEEDTRRWASGLISGAMAPELAERSRVEFDAHVGEVIAARRADPRDDVLSGLIAAERDGVRFTDEEVLAHVRLLFAVGASTTAHGMGNLLSALLHRPELLRRVVDDPQLRPAAVREALRYDPPVSVLPRIIRRETEVAGATLPKDSFLLVGIAAANRDPAMFDDADAFRLDRPPGEILTFGNGVKFCPGSHLAHREIAVALDAVLDGLSGLELADADGALPVGGPLRAPEALHVTWRPA